jgi:hypothetical protein
MDSTRPMIEWIGGSSRLTWLTGFILGFSIVLIGTYLLLVYALSSAGVTVLGPNLELALELCSISVTLAFIVPYVLLVPYPATRLGVSSVGVLMDYGLRSELFPWDRVVVRENRLVSETRRLHLPVSFSLTRIQADRVAQLRPRVP